MGADQYGQTPIDMVRACAFIFVLGMLEHNRERASIGNGNLAEFAVTLFGDDPQKNPLIKLEQVTSGRFKKDRLVYDMWTGLKAQEGTVLASNLKAQVDYLISQPSQGEAKARLIIVMTDEQVNDQQKNELLQTIEWARDHNILIFIAPFGNSNLRKAAANLHEDHPEMLLDTTPIGHVPQGFINAIVEAVRKISPYVADQMDRVRDHAMSVETLNNSSPQIIPEYEGSHFRTQRINGGDYLVFEGDINGKHVKYHFERGIGGPNVSKELIPYTQANEQKILEVLLALYKPNLLPTKVFTHDDRYMVRQIYGNQVEISSRHLSERYVLEHYFDPRELIPFDLDADGQKVCHNLQQLQWKVSAETKTLQLRRNNGAFIDTGISTNQPADQWMFYETNGSIFAFDRESNRFSILSAKGEKLQIDDDLRLFREDLGTQSDGKFTELIGETGTGKDVFLQTISHLLNIEIYSVSGNEDILSDDLITATRSKTAGQSGFEPSVYARAMHYGALFVLDERQKLKPEVFNSWKAYITDRTHKWTKLIASEGRPGEKPVMVEQMVTMTNSPLARFITTANPKRPGIQGSNWLENNAIMRDRRTKVEFQWQSPEDESEWQIKDALKYARKLGISDKDWEEIQASINVEKLVMIASFLRLKFLGYTDNQIAAIKNDWRLLNAVYLEDKIARDDNIRRIFSEHQKDVGAELKRPPSPRVIKNIIRHLIKFPKDREYRPLSVIRMYYNGSVEKDTSNSINHAVSNFEAWDSDKHYLPSELDEKSFEVEGNKIRITPKAAADGKTYWDSFEVPLHPEAMVRQGYIPELVKYWLAEEDNRLPFYEYLQSFALGMPSIFVGLQGTGKSTMKNAVQALLNGQENFNVYVYYDLRTGQVTFQKDVVGPDSVHTPLEMPRAMTGHGSIIGIEEATQGRPGMLAFMNQLLIERLLGDPRRNGAPLVAGPGFGIIMLINDPNSSIGVGAMPDDMIERCRVFRFKPMEPAKILERLKKVSMREELGKGMMRINVRLIGQPLDVDPNKPGFYKNGLPFYIDGTPRYDGFIGLFEEIRRREDDPNQRGQLLPAGSYLGMRAMQDFLGRQLFDRYEYYRMEEDDDNPGIEQSIVFKALVTSLGLTENLADARKWIGNLRKLLQDQHLYNLPNTKDAQGNLIPDAIKQFLSGGDIKVPGLDIIEKPETEYEELDRILNILQDMSSDVKVNMNSLRIHIESWFNNDSWSKADLAEKLRRLWALRRVYVIIRLIEVHRFDPQKSNGFAYSFDDQQTLLGIIDVLKDTLAEKQWPFVNVLEGKDDWRPVIEQYIPILTKLQPAINQERAALRIIFPVDAAMAADDRINLDKKDKWVVTGELLNSKGKMIKSIFVTEIGNMLLTDGQGVDNLSDTGAKNQEGKEVWVPKAKIRDGQTKMIEGRTFVVVLNDGRIVMESPGGTMNIFRNTFNQDADSGLNKWEHTAQLTNPDGSAFFNVIPFSNGNILSIDATGTRRIWQDTGRRDQSGQILESTLLPTHEGGISLIDRGIKFSEIAEDVLKTWEVFPVKPVDLTGREFLSQTQMKVVGIIPVSNTRKKEVRALKNGRVLVRDKESVGIWRNVSDDNGKDVWREVASFPDEFVSVEFFEDGRMLTMNAWGHFKVWQYSGRINDQKQEQWDNVSSFELDVFQCKQFKKLGTNWGVVVDDLIQEEVLERGASSDVRVSQSLIVMDEKIKKVADRYGIPERDIKDILKKFSGGGGVVSNFSIPLSKDRIAVAGANERITILQRTNRKQGNGEYVWKIVGAMNLPPKNKSWVISGQLLEGGRIICVQHNQITIWRNTGFHDQFGQEIWQMIAHMPGHYIQTAVVMSDGGVLTAEWDKTLKIWRNSGNVNTEGVEIWNMAAQWLGHESQYISSGAALRNDLIVSAGKDQMLRFWGKTDKIGSNGLEIWDNIVTLPREERKESGDRTFLTAGVLPNGQVISVGEKLEILDVFKFAYPTETPLPEEVEKKRLLLENKKADLGQRLAALQNKAMSTTNHPVVSQIQRKAPGGIDMNSSNLDLQIKRDGSGMPVPIDQQNLENIKIDGLVPLILNIKPVSVFPIFLELTKS